MKIYTLWGLRRGETMPELMVAWDEYCVDANGEGFVEALVEARKSWGSDLVDDRPLAIDIPDQTIERLFKRPVVRAKVVGSADKGHGTILVGSNELPLTGDKCSVCGLPQYETMHGHTCKNGHGGAPPLEEKS